LSSTQESIHTNNPKHISSTISDSLIIAHIFFSYLTLFLQQTYSPPYSRVLNPSPYPSLSFPLCPFFLSAAQTTRPEKDCSSFQSAVDGGLIYALLATQSAQPALMSE